MAGGDGNPIYCLMSARSTNAKSMAPVTLEVVRIITFGYLKKENKFRLDNCLKVNVIEIMSFRWLGVIKFFLETGPLIRLTFQFL